MQHQRHKYKAAGGSQRHREEAVEELYTDKEGEVKIRGGTLCFVDVWGLPATGHLPHTRAEEKQPGINNSFCFDCVLVGRCRGHKDPLKNTHYTKSSAPFTLPSDQWQIGR